MIRFDERTGYLYATDLGRTSSHFYIKHDTVEVVNELFKSVMTEDKVLDMVSKAQEFEQIKVYSHQKHLGFYSEVNVWQTPSVVTSHMIQLCIHQDGIQRHLLAIKTLLGGQMTPSVIAK